MKQVFRWTLNGAAVVCLLLSGLALLLWALSYLPQDLHVAASDGGLVFVFAEGEQAGVLDQEYFNPADKAKRRPVSELIQEAKMSPHLDRRGRRFGVEWYVTGLVHWQPPRFVDRLVLLVIPLRRLSLVLLLVPSGWLLLRLRTAAVRSRRRRKGLCAQCGHDLRATQGMCPECGTLAAMKWAKA